MKTTFLKNLLVYCSGCVYTWITKPILGVSAMILETQSGECNVNLAMEEYGRYRQMPETELTDAELLFCERIDFIFESMLEGTVV